MATLRKSIYLALDVIGMSDSSHFWTSIELCDDQNDESIRYSFESFAPCDPSI